MGVFGDELTARAGELIARCRAKHLMLATVESCTGGLIAGLITSVPGSSDVLDCGFVTYSNVAKTRMVGVPADLVTRHGAVSEEVARAMAEGALSHCPADIAVAVTGVAGPGGGTALKPVGLVHCAAARRGFATVHRELRLDDVGRDAVRIGTVRVAVEMAYEIAGP
ncbi:MAG: CinA family protein [Aestuariivirga sp.]|uniref:CinA family protein n=1 Tax=Aestuariivirga sp. TaxID=2650926 RepID=UPI0025BA014D|nr:CinA family protein [Aestuariivirga sp.]MCA3560933.1 CinA family protein [Aestuariivirga sp.]